MFCLFQTIALVTQPNFDCLQSTCQLAWGVSTNVSAGVPRLVITAQPHVHCWQYKPDVCASLPSLWNFDSWSCDVLVPWQISIFSQIWIYELFMRYFPAKPFVATIQTLNCSCWLARLDDRDYSNYCLHQMLSRK